MQLFEKFKEVAVSVFPVTLIVLVLHFTVAPLGTGMLPRFFAGALLLIVGLALFLLGTDIGILPMGQLLGTALSKIKKLIAGLLFTFLIGFMITMAEPDLHVLGGQLGSINPRIPKSMLLVVVSVGVGLFVSVGLMRTVYRWSLKKIIFAGYLLVFLLAAITSPYMLPVSFDSGGVTTGPMTVPFIMAFGIGLAKLSTGLEKESEEESFGLVGLMSLGPILATLILGVLYRDDLSGAVYQAAGSSSLCMLISTLIKEVALALLPMIIIFLYFQFSSLKLPLRRVLRIGVGVLYTYFGLVLFLLGVNYGFLPTGSYLGESLSALSYSWIIIPVGILLGFAIVLAEPAVWVLTEQIEKITSGLISRRVMLVSLSIGVASAVGLAMIRIYTGLNIFWLLIPGYFVALFLMRSVDTVFTAIAFDSGGVASGVMASTFILPFALGATTGFGGNVLTDAFGAVAMIAMTPLIAIQTLGVVFRMKRERTATEFETLARIEADIEAEEEALMKQAESLRLKAAELESRAEALRQKRMEALFQKRRQESRAPGEEPQGNDPDEQS